jgi:hypothetical protein
VVLSWNRTEGKSGLFEQKHMEGKSGLFEENHHEQASKIITFIPGMTASCL